MKFLQIPALLAVAFLAGGAFEHVQAKRRALADELSAERAVRIREAQGQRRMMEISDELTQDRLRSERHAVAVDQRLRQLAEATATPAGDCPSRNDDSRPAAGVLRDEDRGDLVALAKEAEAVSDRLRACQKPVKRTSDAVELPDLGALTLPAPTSPR